MPNQIVLCARFMVCRSTWHPFVLLIIMLSVFPCSVCPTIMIVWRRSLPGPEIVWGESISHYSNEATRYKSRVFVPKQSFGLRDCKHCAQANALIPYLVLGRSCTALRPYKRYVGLSRGYIACKMIVAHSSLTDPRPTWLWILEQYPDGS